MVHCSAFVFIFIFYHIIGQRLWAERALNASTDCKPRRYKQAYGNRANLKIYSFEQTLSNDN